MSELVELGANAIGVDVDLGSIVRGLGGIRWSRAEITLRDILATSDMTQAELARIAMDNEAVGGFLATALEIGARTGSEQKRRALGAIVGRALMHQNDAAIVDETELLLSAIEPLETVHVKILVRLHAGERVISDRWSGVLQSELDRVVGSSAVREAVTSTLTSAGLAIAGKSMIERTETDITADSAPGDVWDITEFGEHMLRWLTL